MNERIKELAEQALRESTTLDGIYRPEGYTVHASKSFADKFAELIVEECAKTIEDVHSKELGEYLKKVFNVE
jgi:hypothetical protein